MTLFIGGPFDGRNIETDLNTVQAFNKDAKNPCEEILLYRKRSFFGSRKTFYVYALESMTADDLVVALIEGYKNVE